MLVGSLVLAALAVAACASAQNAAVPSKEPSTVQKKASAKPSVQEQIQALRKELERQSGLIDNQASQIDSLKKGLAEKDARLQQAEQKASQAQAAADNAAANLASEHQAAADNAAAVSVLQTTVKNVQTSSSSLTATFNAETTKIKREIAYPAALHYKAVTFTPGGFVAGDTIFRTKAIGSDIPTNFNSIPLEGDDRYMLSEFYGSARPTRVTLLAEGKPKWGTLRGYLEADFLGVGTNSNNNQTNSYVPRMRLLYGEAEMNNGWKVAFGQMFSLATEGDNGIPSQPSNIKTPLTIDSNYMAGFIYARQFGVRVVKSIDNGKFTLGMSVENPQLIYSAALAGETPYAVLGSAGNSMSYNASISSASATTYVKQYNPIMANEPSTGYYPVYGTVTSTTNIANYSFNAAPDLLIKAVADPGWGHYEIFGLAGFAHETIYPGVTTDSIRYGGEYDVECQEIYSVCSPVAPVADATKTVPNSLVLGGVGASMRIPVIKNLLSFGAKAMYGPGVGRYGGSTLPDVTADQHGALAPIHNLSGLLTLEATPTKRLTLWANYGGDYAARADFGFQGGLGSPNPCFMPTGWYNKDTDGDLCTPPSKFDGSNFGNLGANSGLWGGTWDTDRVGSTNTGAGGQGVGYGSRLATSSVYATSTASASGCGINGIPGYNGSSTGYYPSSSANCLGNTRSVQEVTGGYYYDIYKGNFGRLRQGVQYGYAVREAWPGSNAGGGNTAIDTGNKGIDNMVWTSLRYYLP